MASEIIRMRSAASGYCYYTKKNKKTHPDKLVRLKYDPVLRKKVEFIETRKIDSK